MKIDQHCYLHWEALLRYLPYMTTFTSPPRFETDFDWIPILKQIGKEMFNIELSDYNYPKEVSQELLHKIRELGLKANPATKINE